MVSAFILFSNFYFRAAEDHAKQIEKATRVLENVTCLRFVKHSDENDYITFTGDTNHCSSKVGRRGGEQFIELVNATVGEDCFGLQTILHEILHSLGFYHAHRRSDRDNYLKIVWENVDPDWKYKLEKRKDPEQLTDFGVGWDPDSIMHYGKEAYSKNGENTIETIDEKLIDRIGQRDQLSEKDIERVRKMYKCDE